jgi:hypothetical protein
MYAVEFEADIRNGVVKIPDEFVRLKNTHARVVVLVDEADANPDTHALSDHSASTIGDWRAPDEDDVWT